MKLLIILYFVVCLFSHCKPIGEQRDVIIGSLDKEIIDQTIDFQVGDAKIVLDELRRLKSIYQAGDIGTILNSIKNYQNAVLDKNRARVSPANMGSLVLGWKPKPFP